MQPFTSAIPNAELAFAALRAIESGSPADPADALAIVRGLTITRTRRALRRISFPAGGATECLPPVGSAPVVAPAPGSVRGFDERRAGVALYRTVAAGRLGDRHVPEGARVLVGRRRAEKGEWLLVATRSALRIVEAGARGEPSGLVHARPLGVVEGIVSAA